MIASDNNYPVITIQGDTVSSPLLAYGQPYVLTSLPHTQLQPFLLPFSKDVLRNFSGYSSKFSFISKYSCSYIFSKILT